MEIECVENNFIDTKNIEKKPEFINENSQQQLSSTDTEELSDPDDDDFFIERRSDDAIIDDIKKWILRPIKIYNKNDDINPMIPDEEFELISKNGAEKSVDLFLNNSKINPLYVRSYVYDLSLLINKQNPYNGDFKNDMKNYIEKKCIELYKKKNSNDFKLIGELYFHKIIKINYLRYCIDDLIKNHNDNDIICLIKLIKSSGYSGKLKLNHCYDMIKKIIDDKKLSNNVINKLNKLSIIIANQLLYSHNFKSSCIDLNKQYQIQNYMMNMSPSNKPETGNIESLRQFRRQKSCENQDDNRCHAEDYHVIKNIELYNLNPIEYYNSSDDDDCDNELIDDQYDLQTKSTTETITKLIIDRGRKNSIHSRSYAIEIFNLMNKQKYYLCEYRDVIQDYVETQCMDWINYKKPNDYLFIGELWFYRILSNEFIRGCIKLLINHSKECDIECLIKLAKGGGWSVALKLPDYKERLLKIYKYNNFKNDVKLKLKKLIERCCYEKYELN